MPEKDKVARQNTVRKAVRRWAAKNENGRRKNLRDRYGMSIEEYDALLASQDHKCAICGLEMDEGKRLAVDHCHKTGKVRGIVHVRCNSGIASFLDSPEICRKAAEYLERHSSLGDQRSSSSTPGSDA